MHATYATIPVKTIELTQQLVKDLREMTGLHFDDPIYQEKVKKMYLDINLSKSLEDLWLDLLSH